MASPTLNIALTGDLECFIEAEAAKGGHETPGDYVRALVQREQDILRARALFDEAEASPQGPAVDDAYWERQRERIRRHTA